MTTLSYWLFFHSSVSLNIDHVLILHVTGDLESGRTTTIISYPFGFISHRFDGLEKAVLQN